MRIRTTGSVFRPIVNYSWRKERDGGYRLVTRDQLREIYREPSWMKKGRGDIIKW